MARAVPRYNRRSSLSTPTTTTDDESDGSSKTNSRSSSPNEPVKYLTPQKYRRAKQAQQATAYFHANSNQLDENFDERSTASQQTDYSGSSSRFHLGKAFSSNSFAPQKDKTSPQTKRRLLYNRFPIVVGEFIMTEKPGQDKSIYNYQPKHTQVPLVYKGVVQGLDVQQRALNEMKQLVQQRSRTSSAHESSPGLHEKRYLPSSDDFAGRLQSTRNEEPVAPRPRDSLYESLRRDSQSSFSLNGTSSFTVESPYQRFTPTSSVYLGEKDNRYYFGKGLVDVPFEDEESSSSEIHRDTDHRPREHLRTFNPRIPDIDIAEVTDAGTETDNTSTESHTFVPLAHSTKRSNDPVTPIEPKTSVKVHRPTTSTVESSGSAADYYKARSYEDVRSLKRLTEHQSEEEEADEISLDGERYYLPRESNGQASKKPQSSSTSTITTTASAAPKPLPPAGMGRRYKENAPIESPPYQPYGETSLSDITPQYSQSVVKPKKSRSGFFVPKPPTVTTQTSEVFGGRPTAPIPRTSTSSPITDYEEEIRGRPSFIRPVRLPQTPGPRPDSPQDDNDRDIMPHTNGHLHLRGKPSSQKHKLIDEATQSDERSTRTVGTMPEPVQTRSNGNDVQPQTSSTQTSFPPVEKRDITPPATIRPHTHRSPSRSPHPVRQQRYYPDDHRDHHRRDTIRTPPPPEVEQRHYPTSPYRRTRKPVPPAYEDDDDYDHTDDPYEPDFQDDFGRAAHPPDYSDGHQSRPRSTSSTRRPRRHSPPELYQYDEPIDIDYSFSIRDRRRTTSPIHRPSTPTPVRSTRSPSPYHRPPSAPPRQRPRMRSQETDTSLDSMKRQRHTGIQYEPRSTQDRGTTPSLRVRQPPAIRRSPHLNTSTHSQPAQRTSQSSTSKGYQHTVPRYEQPYRKEYVRRSIDDGHRREREEDKLDDERRERAPSMHDHSTMADLIVSFDHYTQYDAQPFTADRFIQTTPVRDEMGEDEASIDVPEEQDVRQLPGNRSISIPQPLITQPDTLPRARRPHRSPTRPGRDGLDYTGSNLEVPLHRAQQQRTLSIRNSPLLNIGTENILRQLPANEMATPFETFYVYESDGTSTLTRHQYRTSRNNSLRRPVLNSSRTHHFQRDSFGDTPASVRQSRTNGNFFLSSPPIRSINSSFRLDISRDDS